MKITIEITTSGHEPHDFTQADIVLDAVRAAMAQTTGARITGFSWEDSHG